MGQFGTAEGSLSWRGGNDDDVVSPYNNGSEGLGVFWVGDVVCFL